MLRFVGRRAIADRPLPTYCVSVSALRRRLAALLHDSSPTHAWALVGSMQSKQRTIDSDSAERGKLLLRNGQLLRDSPWPLAREQCNCSSSAGVYESYLDTWLTKP